jgi:hypothetical protein
VHQFAPHPSHTWVLQAISLKKIKLKKNNFYHFLIFLNFFNLYLFYKILETRHQLKKRGVTENP